jgi:hypothetical protein
MPHRPASDLTQIVSRERHLPKCRRASRKHGLHAQPSPPVVLVAPRSNAYHLPFRSASVGAGSSSNRQRSIKWECAAARSLSSAVFHLAMNRSGLTGRGVLMVLGPRSIRRRGRIQWTIPLLLASPLQPNPKKRSGKPARLCGAKSVPLLSSAHQALPLSGSLAPDRSEKGT